MQNIKNIKNQIFSLNNILSLIIIFLMLCLIISPTKYIQSASNGINLWVKNLLPALFPFFVLSKILMDLNFLEKPTRFLNPLMQKIFGTSNVSSYIFIISILSGYPLGSKLVLDAYNSNKISLQEAHRLVSFTSVSGPLFIVGTVGCSMLYSTLCGYIMLFSHICGAILNGITYRNYSLKTQENLVYAKFAPKKNSNLLNSAVKNSIDSILLIGGLVCIFYVSIDAICSVIQLPILFQGIIEITTGCNAISLNLNYSQSLQTILCCFVITFGGLCTHAQSMYFLKQCNINYKFFLKQKITHTLYSTAICSILCLCFL